MNHLGRGNWSENDLYAHVAEAKDSNRVLTDEELREWSHLSNHSEYDIRKLLQYTVDDAMARIRKLEAEVAALKAR